MMNAEAVRQRVKFAVEHGEVYPTVVPLDKPLAMKLLLIVIALQLTEIAVTLALR